MKDVEPHERLKQARIAAHYETVTAAAEALGVKLATYTAHENGGREFDRKDAVKYARRFKVRPGWLMFGENEAAPSASSKIREVDPRAGAGAGGIDSEQVSTTKNGITISADATAALWEIPDAFLRGELRMAPATAYIIEVQGDSGYDPAFPGAPGSLFPGDRAIVNTADRRPSPPGPFLVWDGTGLVIKMVETVHGTDPPMLRLNSRNPRYSSYEVSIEEAHIVGRVRGKISSM